MNAAQECTDCKDKIYGAIGKRLPIWVFGTALALSAGGFGTCLAYAISARTSAEEARADIKVTQNDIAHIKASLERIERRLDARP